MSCVQLEEFRAKKLAGKAKQPARTSARSAPVDINIARGINASVEDSGVENRDPAFSDAPLETAIGFVAQSSASAAPAATAPPAQPPPTPVPAQPRHESPSSGECTARLADEANMVSRTAPGDPAEGVGHAALKHENGQLRAQLQLLESSQVSVHAQLEASKSQLSSTNSEHMQAKLAWEQEMSQVSSDKREAMLERDAALQRAGEAERKLADSSVNASTQERDSAQHAAESQRLRAELQTTQQQLSEALASAEVLQQQLGDALAARDKAITGNAATVDELHEKLASAERDHGNLQDAIEAAQESHSTHMAELNAAFEREKASLLQQIQILEDEKRAASTQVLYCLWMESLYLLFK